MVSGTILWDASGLVKRYIIEVGSDTVDAVFAEATGIPMAVTPWGYLETYAILRRRHHAGAFNAVALTVAITSLQQDVIYSGSFGLLPIHDGAIFAATSLIDTHHINSADAAILSTYLRFQARQPQSSAPCLLIASDKRLLRAAAAEGLHTLNPELLPPSAVPAFLAAP